MDSQCPGCLGQAVVTLRLPCAIVESPRRDKRVPFVNIAFLRSRSIKRRQWKHKMDYCGVVFAHLATGCGINAKDPSGLDSDRWIPHSRCCENPARAKALAGFSRHLSAGFTDLNPAPRGLSLYNSVWSSDAIWCHKSGLTLGQVMACCLPVPSHYLNQCLLITSMVHWYWHWCLKSPASRLFTQPFVQAQIEENIKASSHWPSCGEFTSDPWKSQ